MAGFPPPPDGPPVGATISLSLPAGPTASICGFDFGLPTLSLLLVLPTFEFPPTFSFFFSFKLTCKLPNPIDISAGAGLSFGAGRVSTAPPDLDDFEDAA